MSRRESRASLPEGRHAKLSAWTRSKRRRNTAASARFRMKKKEREQALEKHAKELEDRLGRMERDMDSLRKGEWADWSKVFKKGALAD